MPRLFRLLIILLFFLSFNSKAQTRLDSLITVLDKQSLNKENYVNIRLKTIKLIINESPNIGQKYLLADLSFFEKTNEVKIQGELNSELGFCNDRLGDYRQAIIYYNRAIDLFETINDNRICWVLGEIGYCYGALGETRSELKYLNKGLEYGEKHDLSKDVSLSLLRIGVWYERQNKLSEALKYYEQALKLSKEVKHDFTTTEALGQLAALFNSIGDYEKALEYCKENIRVSSRETADRRWVSEAYTLYGDVLISLDSLIEAKKYLEMALNISKKIKHLMGMAIANESIGLVYEKEGNLTKAQLHYYNALELWENTGRKRGVSSSSNRLAKIHGDLGEHDEAIEFGLKAYKNAKDLNSIDNIVNSSKQLWLSYKATNQTDYAFKYLEIYAAYKDSLNIKGLELDIANKDFEFFLMTEKEKLLAEKEKSRREAEIQQKEKKQQEFISAISLGGLAVVLLFSGLIYRSLRKTRKQKKIIELSEIEAQKQKERAEKSEAFKQQFLANMSHEIRTPMNAVMGMTNLVLDTPLEPKQKDYLTKVKKSSDNLLHIINDILDLSKIEAGKMELEEIDMSLKDTVDQVKQTLLHKAEEKGLELITKVDASLNDIVLGDPVRLNQVLINLTGNAIKFTEKGSVAIELKKVDEKVRFSIIDTGIGIPKDKIKTVFENFGQANSSDTRKYGGTGLGLSISQQLVNLMGSNIEIESEVGRGTTFFFDVELADGNKDRYEERMAGEENVDGSILDGLTILVADDNEYNRIVARDTLLSKAKLTIIEAENGQEAVNKLTQGVDIILMDAQMPIMSGFEASRKIREQGNDVPIIALTASVLRTDLDRCKDAGMNGYIPKPFKTHELIVGIAEALNIQLKLNKEQAAPKVEKIPQSHDRVSNLDYLTDFCNGDQSKMQKYIDMFLKSAGPFLEQLEKLIQEQDAEGIANHVHGFNTKLTMMGMKEVKSLSIEIENELRDDLEQSSDATIDKVKELIQFVTKAVEELS